MTYFKRNAHRLFEGHYIKHAEYLTAADYERAAEILASGNVEFSRLLGYVRGWASDYAHEARCETAAARDFEDRAYGTSER